MTTQREPDTSAERLRKIANRLEASLASDRKNLLAYEIGPRQDAIAALRALADAAGQAAPVPPPVEGLEIDDELWARWVSWEAGATSHSDPGTRKLVRDFARWRGRAEGLAKEVERLKAQALEDAALIGRLNGGAELQAVMKINNDLVAKLAVYEAPIGDGEVYEAAEALRLAMTTASNDDLSKPGTEDRKRHVKRLAAMENGIDAIFRLSAAHAECKGENTKLREAARRAENWFAAFGFNQHGIAVKDDFEDHEEIRSELRAALAPASGEKAT